MDLWRICFDDSEEFIQVYFEQVYKEANALTIEQEGRIIAALQIIPYTMTWCETELTLSYISGACTAPEERGKGHMGRLLTMAFQKMRERQTDLTALIPAEPWLFDYYRKLGYTETFDYALIPFEHKTGQETASSYSFFSLDVKAGDIWYAFFDRKLRERPLCILHTREDFHTILRDIQMSKGQTIGVTDSLGKPVGMAFIVPEKNNIYIKEILYENDAVKNILWQKGTELFGAKQGVCKLPVSHTETAHPLGMSLILNKEKMINRWLAKHPHTSFCVEEMRELEDATLTRTLLGYADREGYMSLMLD
ncbi:GNAT family N-acetyltransferase [Parabacteroides sp. 52]|nr:MULTISPECIES: GNAT family N-acetyltransferase [unclassified Parabacteroides]NDV54331.1 GNAT family N-acetyltransferase [Parabacteroides sp. 52]